PKALYQQWKRIFLLLESVERALAHLCEKRFKCGIIRNLGAQHHRVDEVADERFKLGPRSTRRGSADENFFLICVAVKEYLQGCQQSQVERCAAFTADCFQQPGQLCAQSERLGSALIGLNRWPATVCRKIQYRQFTGQLIAPVCP